jgi:hypothetical protein
MQKCAGHAKFVGFEARQAQDADVEESWPLNPRFQGTSRVRLPKSPISKKHDGDVGLPVADKPASCRRSTVTLNQYRASTILSQLPVPGFPREELGAGICAA